MCNVAAATSSTTLLLKTEQLPCLNKESLSLLQLEMFNFNQPNIPPKPTSTPHTYHEGSRHGVVFYICILVVVVFVCLHLTCIKWSKQATSLWIIWDFYTRIYGILLMEQSFSKTSTRIMWVKLLRCYLMGKIQYIDFVFLQTLCGMFYIHFAPARTWTPSEELHLEALLHWLRHSAVVGSPHLHAQLHEVTKTVHYFAMDGERWAWWSDWITISFHLILSAWSWSAWNFLMGRDVVCLVCALTISSE